MKRTLWIVLGLVLALTALAAVPGCAKTTTKETENKAEAPEIDISSIVSDWVSSKHSGVVEEAAKMAPCAGCHDGGAFATQTVDPAKLGRDWPVATDCRVCHTQYGKSVLESGKTAASGPWSVPTTNGPVTAGMGAVCMSCHHERVKPSISATGTSPGSRIAPHPSSQAGMFLGTGGIRQSGFAYGTTKKHQSLENACVTCHMADNAKGLPNHTFMPLSVDQVCKKCHKSITDFDRTALADYDGNGKIQGIQEEVKGLVSLLDTASSAKMKGAKRTLSHGQIFFVSGATTSTAPIPDDVYQAAFNASLAEEDKSFGIHNPVYEIELLQQSYKALTGKEVPNGKILTGSK